jgi:hypothetical protein
MAKLFLERSAPLCEPNSAIQLAKDAFALIDSCHKALWQNASYNLFSDSQQNEKFLSDLDTLLATEKRLGPTI